MYSNVYEYLCGKIDNIPQILSLGGADRRYTGKNASDFERFRELCSSLVKFTGSSFYEDINYAASELFGEKIDITQTNPETLWKRFYGERGERKAIAPVLACKIAYADKLATAIDISQATDFIVPDKYHVGLAREKCLGGCDLSGGERNMMIMQELREGAQNCIYSSHPLIVRADCSTEIICRALGYLKTCNMLTETLILVSLDRLDAEMMGILELDKISLGILVDKCDESFVFSMQSYARSFPIGNVIWALKKENFVCFCDIMEHLIKKWQKESMAPQNCELKFEEICKFY